VGGSKKGEVQSGSRSRKKIEKKIVKDVA